MKLKNIAFTPLFLALVLSGCAVGPDYQRPAPTSVPLQYKEAKGWQQAKPQDQANKGEWWAVYHDATLSSLLGQVSISNQNVAQYEAQYRQAKALAAESRSDLFPTLSGTGSGTRSGSKASSSASQRSVSNSFSAEASASWELDLWGKLRRTLEENKASAQASQAELANITLSAQSELAQDYFQLRIMDQQIALYQQSVQAYERYLQVINNKYQAGAESRSTLAQAQLQLESARASALDYVWQRAQLEHAIALLIGKTPAEFSLAAAPLSATMPAIPHALPSELLQRRPDIAYAERNVAAANAAVGVAIAGYYPDLTLSASGGFTSSALHNLISLPNRVWSLGPELSGTLLDFGATSAKVEQARAAYDASVASYRQAVLQGFTEVENYLVQLNTLQDELAAQQRAATAAQDSARVTRNQYEAGMIDYLDVATTENASLSQQQSLLSLQSTQWVASVELIAALGGGWDAKTLAP
ncbi:NodT family efflux transporter outer membrane factor (OMF) lipoprotein [Gibbsiella quercinecans]|uniref:RND transporter n=1 Tax=Gibbsiella quercinecans TaxID=929813 RepID=A0A250AWR9_9GAMM|nr:efflux transporter outer membrane subunit [Gibbsiella quercinecans]ATA18367.1 RND transporter [Gibbsiella quercinecans]RLM07160.1 RND transporter [Gibbsiella quercinecans]RLM13089.1 RND transporter [Gibbsiella quercinecans]RLM14424.1 RND transporter [Gibbsiella quercinecans]TCT90962.1 NodT family efflux transporter outer membrane factor (OMF) lipoprotein [Gibbsiella quercinecans]